jgi:hypothetical protein
VKIAILLLASAAGALAQLDDDTLTITSTRTISLTPDQAVVNIYLSGPVGGGLEAAVAALQGSGVTAADLASIGTSPNGDDQSVQWVFNRTVSFSQLGTTLAALDSLRRRMAHTR